MAATWNPVFDWDKESWREGASCRQTTPELFFPAGTTGQALEQITAAKAVCRTCAVQSQCLEFALDTNQEAGIWGGTDEVERRRLRRVRRAGRRRRASAETGRESTSAEAGSPGRSADRACRL